MPKIELRDYQLDALKRMKNGSILCGGVGSGKSRTALAYYYIQNGGKVGNEFSRMFHPQDLYIVTTARKRDTLEWESEMIIFEMSPKEEDNHYKNTVVVDSWNNIRKYVGVEKAFFIFDEQRVVGKGAWVKAFLKITKKNNWILLSATPGDKWEDYIPVFMANGFYKTKGEFNRDHLIYAPYTKFPKVTGSMNTGKFVRLRRDILVDMDFKRDTVSHHEDIWCDYDIPAYKEICRYRWDPYKVEPIVNAAQYCYCLRRCVNTSDDRQLKLLELVEKHPKSIIFYNMDCELELLRELFDKNKERFWQLDGFEVGEWNGHKHDALPEGDKWVYLVQYTAGCEGWNCIKTDTIIFYSQNYSYRTTEQARGRIDRMNTPFKDLYFYHLKSRSSIDLAISKALNNKKQFNEGKFYG